MRASWILRTFYSKLPIIVGATVLFSLFLAGCEGGRTPDTTRVPTPILSSTETPGATASQPSSSAEATSTQVASITPHATATARAVASMPPMDLVYDLFDYNNIPIQPRWAWQVERGTLPDADFECDNFNPANLLGSPPCASQEVQTDVPRELTINSAICSRAGLRDKVNGHVNWTPALHEGTIYFKERATDDDLHMQLLTANGAGLTVANETSPRAPDPNQKLLVVEFDARETVDHFQTDWWAEFSQAADQSTWIRARLNPDVMPARDMVDGHRAIVIGLHGLDSGHTSYTELHPTWLLAIQTQVGTFDETWAIFARNWGNEGYCSQQQHRLEMDELKVRIPWKAGMTALAGVEGTEFLANFSPVEQPTIEWAPDEGVLVTFTLPQPEAQGRIHGELHLRYSGPQAAALQFQKFQKLQAPLASFAAHPAAQPAERSGDAEELLAQLLLEEATPGQRQAFLNSKQQAELELGTRSPDNEAPRAAVDHRQVPNLPRPLGVVSEPPPVESEFDPAKAERDDVHHGALLEAFGGQIPGYENVPPPPER